MANLPDNEVAQAEPADDSWRNKWLYINPYYNYSLLFLALKSEGLHAGSGVYDDTLLRIFPIDNRLVTMPGIGVGVEFQFLNFMSVEPGVLISMEEVLSGHMMYNLLFSLELKFPLKFFRNIVIEPYGAAAYPLRFPKGLEIFTKLPMFAYGGGVEVAVKVGKSGALFFDVNYMYYGDTAMKNPYAPLAPNPKEIHYDRSVLGFGIGYKFGFADRKH